MSLPPDVWFCKAPLSLPEAWLSEAELTKVQRLKDPDTRQLAITAHALKRYALSQRRPQIEPADWQFVSSPSGKPELPGRECHFNLSHCDYACALAIDEEPIGIDVERERPLTNLDALARRVLSHEEHRWLRAQSRPASHLVRLWTIKEAALKASGYGLRMDPRTVLICSPDSASTHARMPDGSRWACQSLPMDDYWLTVATRRFSRFRLRTTVNIGHG